MGGLGGALAKLKRAVRKIVLTCDSFSQRRPAVPVDYPLASFQSQTTTTTTTSMSSVSTPGEANDASGNKAISSTSTTATKNLCAICLDPLSYGTAGTSPGQTIFTARCSHAFHFACISSNIRHGSVTCPICRAHWTQLPRNLSQPCSLSCNQTDPILQILDDSIARSLVHRRSFPRSTHYNDDDPIEPDQTPHQPRLCITIIPVPPLTRTSCHPCSHQSFLQVTDQPNSCHSRGLLSRHSLSGNSSLLLAAPPGNAGQHFRPTRRIPNYLCTHNDGANYLSVTLAHHPATDLVLVASPNEPVPHLRLMKQSMALVVFSLRSIDRLAIVIYSSSAAPQFFPLRRMTSYGKRTALQIIDRLFSMGGQGDDNPIEGLKKGIKILGDRAYKNPRSFMLHLSDNQTRSYHCFDMEVSDIPIHRFHIGFGLGTPSGFVMHELEKFLMTRVLGGVIKEIWLRIGKDGRITRFGELRDGEERRIPFILGESSGHVYVEYSYIEGVGDDEYCTRTGEILVGM